MVEQGKPGKKMVEYKGNTRYPLGEEKSSVTADYLVTGQIKQVRNIKRGEPVLVWLSDL